MLLDHTQMHQVQAVCVMEVNVHKVHYHTPPREGYPGTCGVY